jgi:hypothetical protein
MDVMQSRGFGQFDRGIVQDVLNDPVHPVKGRA